VEFKLHGIEQRRIQKPDKRFAETGRGVSSTCFELFDDKPLDVLSLGRGMKFIVGRIDRAFLQYTSSS